MSFEELTAIGESMNLSFFTYKPTNNHKELTDSIKSLVDYVDDKREQLSNSRDW
jgi:hypothetical protein